MSSDIDHDPDDMFKDTRMSFGDHIEELRTHLIRAIKCFVIGMVIGFWPLGQYVLRIIVAPVEDQLYEFEKRKLRNEMLTAKKRLEESGLATAKIRANVWMDKNQVLEELGLKPKEPVVLERTVRGFEHMFALLEAEDLLDEENRKQTSFMKLDMVIPDPVVISEQVMKTSAEVRRPRLSTMGITEAFMVYLKIAMMTGLVISSPWVFYHIWMFIAAGLYPQEKKLVNVYLPFSLFLFIGGVLLCQFAVMPNAVRAMLWFNEWLGMSADLRLNEWLGFALMMPLIFGLSFQTPLVMMFLHKIGLVPVQTFRDYRRVAFFTLCAVAVVFMPTPDPQSILFLWIPLCGLYELGILLCVYQGEQNTLLGWLDEQKSDELVEV